RLMVIMIVVKSQSRWAGPETERRRDGGADEEADLLSVSPSLRLALPLSFAARRHVQPVRKKPALIAIRQRRPSAASLSPSNQSMASSGAYMSARRAAFAVQSKPNRKLPIRAD